MENNKKSEKRTTETKFRVAVYFSTYGAAESFHKLLTECNYIAELTLIPDQNLENMQDFIKEQLQNVKK
jgi:hypothetical protein